MKQLGPILAVLTMHLDISSTTNRKIIDLRTLGSQSLQVLGKYNYTKAEKKLPEHTHGDMIEICYCDKGKQYFYVNQDQFLVSGGEIFVHYPNEKHGTGQHLESKGSLYWMIIDLNCVNENDKDIVFICKQLIDEQIRQVKGNGRQKYWLDEIFNHYYKDSGTLRNIRICTLVKNFLLSILDSVENRKNNSDSSRLTEILNYINKNINESLSISDLAYKMNLSESRFKILFKEITGLTPNDYVQRRRIDAAINILKTDNEISLRDLAYRFNFSSPQYFSTVVKKYMGISPSDMRKKYQPEVER